MKIQQPSPIGSTSSANVAPPQTFIRRYKGSESVANRKFDEDIKKMAALGWVPTGKNWVPGAYSGGDFVVAILLCFILIGILVFIYMLVVKPDGTLTVTYEPRSKVAEKTCPKCAEKVKEAALVCRFCGHTFVTT